MKTIRPTRALLFVALALAALAAIGGAPAAASNYGTCTTSGQPWGASYAWGPSGTVNVNQGVEIPYGGNSSLCYSLADTGSQSIGSDKTHSRTFASSSYIPLGYCLYISSTSITVSFAGVWGSGTATATNWNASDTRHWALGAEFNQNVSGLETSTPANDFMSIGPNCISDYGCPDSQDITCDGHRGPSHGVFADTSLRARRIANPAALTPITRTYAKPGTYRLQCPNHQVIVSSDASTSADGTGVLEGAFIDHGRRTARAHVVSLPSGETASAQIVCRRAGAARFSNAKLIWGADGDQSITSTTKGQQIFAGVGANSVTGANASVTAFGGYGDDAITLNGSRSVAVGGVGDDTLVDNSGSSILEGGLGADTLTSAKGHTRINAVDGSADDTVICNPGSQAAVVIDKGDTVQGSCGRVRVIRGGHA